MNVIETIFDILYLVFVISIGIIMVSKSKGNTQYRLFGIMAIILGFGDSFHLVPRCIALITSGFDRLQFSLGIGKLITSITMTIFYVVLFHIWIIRYNIKGKRFLKVLVYLLAVARIILCAMPQNQWTENNSPLIWGIYRNIPFALIGLIVIILFYKSAKLHNDLSFKWLWLTIVLSFGFYIPVVLFSHIWPMIGMLMMPKTLSYVWTVLIGYRAMKNEI